MEERGKARALYAPVPVETERVGKAVLDAAFKVHSKLGAGLLESVYESCMVYELHENGICAQAQVTLPIKYEKLSIEAGLRLDILADHCVIAELKSVDALLPVHQSQLLTYLKMSGLRLGFLINFNVPRLKSGIIRMVV